VRTHSGDRALEPKKHPHHSSRHAWTSTSSWEWSPSPSHSLPQCPSSSSPENGIVKQSSYCSEPHTSCPKYQSQNKKSCEPWPLSRYVE
jgi:hypothetical protein